MGVHAPQGYPNAEGSECVSFENTGQIRTDNLVASRGKEARNKKNKFIAFGNYAIKKEEEFGP